MALRQTVPNTSVLWLVRIKHSILMVPMFAFSRGGIGARLSMPARAHDCWPTVLLDMPKYYDNTDDGGFH